MMSTTERLVYMINQIARNLAIRGADEAARATAEHVVDFWEPRMREALLALQSPPLDAIAGQAVAMLRARASQAVLVPSAHDA